MPDDRTIFPFATSGNLGVVIGGCDFSNRLHRDLNVRFSNVKFFSWSNPDDERKIRLIDPTNLTEVMGIFDEEGVLAVLNAGEVHVELLKQQMVRMHGSSPDLISRCEALFASPRDFYRDYGLQLFGAGIDVVSLRHAFPDFRMEPGQRGLHALPEWVGERMSTLKAQAIDACDRDRPGAIAQAVVFDLRRKGNITAYVETQTTDQLLTGLPRKKRGAYRILVKIKPKQIPEHVDDPQIGLRTIEVAREAGVQAIALDALCGVVIDRAETIALADLAGLAIVGI